MSEASNQILIEEIQCKQGKVGRLSLNAPKSLNSLNLDMIRALKTTLDTWADDSELSCVLLDGVGEKAFCAGGDVQALYRSATEQPGGPCEYAEQFFLEEYQLDYLIHTYGKPIICMGRGITMGGGLGLMAGASHRVVTPTTRIAMPEITIGLFPDVGGTRFLNDMPRGLGLFFALTGASINANDAIYLQLADFFLNVENSDALVDELVKQKWLKTPEKNHELATKLLERLGLQKSDYSSITRSELEPCLGVLECICRAGALGEIASAMQAVSHDSSWLAKAIKTYSQGSPLSALLIFEQLRRHRYSSLKQTFESELTLATNVVRYPEFSEGVRALLIDKDKSPNWQFDHFSHVPASVMEHFFTAPWPQNPLEERLT